MAKKEAEEKKRVGKKSAGDWAVDIFISIVFGLFTLVCIFPFYYIFINTISNNNLVITGKISLFPQGIHFENYVRVLTLKELPPPCSFPLRERCWERYSRFSQRPSRPMRSPEMNTGAGNSFTVLWW